MSVLVLGRAGSIGSHVVYQLTDQGADVVIVDNSDKARQVLGWSPSHASITKIIEDAWKCILHIQTATKRTCENGL